MADLAFIYDPTVERHETGPGHPEAPSRTRTIYKRIRECTLCPRIAWREPRIAEVEAIEAIHTPEYRRFIEEACLGGGTMVDAGETLVGEESYLAARLAVGGGLTAIDIAIGEGLAAFSCGRPPGHHASQARAMGFCLFNNVAIAARYAQRRYGLERVMILDWDVHHGNGTQDIFWEDSSVLFCSLHQVPLYPGSGAADETGSSDACGTTLNIPMAPNASLGDYQAALDGPVAEAARSFKPELILLSAGFDAHRADPLADICLESREFAVLTRQIRSLALELTNYPLVSLLEGGYHLSALAESVEAHLGELAGG